MVTKTLARAHRRSIRAKIEPNPRPKVAKRSSFYHCLGGNLRSTGPLSMNIDTTIDESIAAIEKLA